MTDTKIGVDLTATPTASGEQLGARFTDITTGTEYEYVQANGAIAQYAAVKIDDDLQAAELTTTISGAEPTRVGVAQVAFADNDYGWVAIKGNMSVLAAASCAADVKVYTTATAGVIDDATSSVDCVLNLKLTAACGGAQAATAAFAASYMVTNAQDDSL